MEAPLAEPGQRLLARIVDTLVVGLPVIIVVRELVSGHTVDVVAPPAVAGCMLLYEAIQLALWGRTIGKRLAGIEVVIDPAGPSVYGRTPRGDAGEAAVSVDRPVAMETPAGASAGGDGAVPMETAAEAGAEFDTASEGESAVEKPESVPIGDGARPDAVRAVLRAAIYSLPIAARPIPVLGLLGGVFWVANAGALYEGTRRQAVHDRLTGTLVVKSAPSDSTAF
ncbi:RDD family protein [Actinomadura chibensis]|uniref:RDD family protein n=1 Tax=Actinomadura chibensis TaxID=392828 RepID=UPI0008373E04|nr:RDD family protein [Actinomadura chibensis]